MNNELKGKIKELFKYRKLPILLELAGTSKKEEKVFYGQLIELQAAIYDLDLYLESNWELDDAALKEWWKHIYTKLTALKLPKKKHAFYVRQILKYQKHEMSIRYGKLPTSYTMEYFYYYKSCDVKLIRQLIYDKFPKLNSHFSLVDWRLFDLVTEMVDDLSDVEEDTEVYNGNRFLISALTKKKKQTFADFDLFLNEIDRRLEDDKWSEGDLEMLKEWTDEVIFEADEILDELAIDYPGEMIYNSKIATEILNEEQLDELKADNLEKDSKKKKKKKSSKKKKAKKGKKNKKDKKKSKKKEGKKVAKKKSKKSSKKKKSADKKKASKKKLSKNKDKKKSKKKKSKKSKK